MRLSKSVNKNEEISTKILNILLNLNVLNARCEL